MTTEIRVSVSPGERRIAVLQDGTLLDYAIDRPGAPDGVGDLHCARLIAHMPALAGAFVALVDAEGFLPDSEGARGRPAGTLLTVEITRAAQAGKGPRLRAHPSPTPGPVRRLSRGPDAMTRLSAQHPEAAILIDDPGIAATLRAATVRVTPHPWTEALSDAVADLAEPTITLPGGARLHVHPTPALTAIDIDTAAASADHRAKPTAQAALNRTILPAIAAQIRLRNLSGGIVIDLAGMKTRRRIALSTDFAACLAADPLHPRFLGFTALGFAEILRPRIHPPLHERLAGPHAAGLAALRDAARRIAAAPAERLALFAAPAVAASLEADAFALAELAHRAGRPLMLRSEASLPPHTWRLETLR